jgi:regulatory protein
MKAARPPLSLKARALQWLAQREHSRLELRRKLITVARRRDADLDDPPDPAAEVDALLDLLVGERHLSDARFVESRVHARSARFGNRRILHELAQHGAAPDAATAEQLHASETARARAVWLRKFGSAPPADAAARARQMRFLAGRGFSAEVVRRVVNGNEDES